MNNNLKTLALIIIGIIVLYIFQTKYSEHNLNKTISSLGLNINYLNKNKFNLKYNFKHTQGIVIEFNGFQCLS